MSSHSLSPGESPEGTTFAAVVRIIRDDIPRRPVIFRTSRLREDLGMSDVDVEAALDLIRFELLGQDAWRMNEWDFRTVDDVVKWVEWKQRHPEEYPRQYTADDARRLENTLCAYAYLCGRLGRLVGSRPLIFKWEIRHALQDADDVAVGRTPGFTRRTAREETRT